MKDRRSYQRPKYDEFGRIMRSTQYDRRDERPYRRDHEKQHKRPISRSPSPKKRQKIEISQSEDSLKAQKPTEREPETEKVAEEIEEETEEEKMKRMMGFGGFDSTKAITY